METSTPSSLLEKPLSQLTEDDIGQITREECRRFLKDRGMRRPSWNKSQAIQQVISLKALLEVTTDPDDLTNAIKLRPSPRSLTSPHSSLPSPSGSGNSRELKDPSPYRRKDPISPVFTAFESLCPPSRIVAGVPAAQLTIFYGGKINVYEGVPSDKAREIFRLAATPDLTGVSTVAPVPSGRRFGPPYCGPVDRGPGGEPGSYYLNAPSGNLQRSFKEGIEEGRASLEPVPEGPTSRKASLKRYLDKRKDRYKGRRIIAGSSVESMYLSQKLDANLQEEPSGRSNSSSVLPVKAPCPRMRSCTSSFEPKNLGFYVDLNEDAAGGN